jgi:ribosomal protein S18 acetylase RimI-like enzyme
MINVRMAQINDVGTISSVLAASWKAAYRGMIADDYLDALKNDHWVEFLESGMNGKYILSMVLEDDYIVVGAALLGETEEDGEIHLISFYLLPDKTRQGLGRSFYRDVEREMRNRGYTKCSLDVLENNTRAIRFYEAQGFADVGLAITAVLGGQKYRCKVMEKPL